MRDIVVDVDGVLADFNGKFVLEFGPNRQELESLESRYPECGRDINRFVNDPLTYKSLEPISLGLTLVNYLNDAGFDVNIVTSRPIGTEWVTRKWLKRHGVKYLSLGVYPNKILRIAEIALVVWAYALV